MATAHMAKYGTTPEMLMAYSIKAHNNGALNPKAQMPLTVRDIMDKRIERAKQKGQAVPNWADEYEFLKSSANPMIAYPLRLFDCSLITDGASCVFLASEEVAKRFTDTPIWIIGSGQGSDTFSLDDRHTITSLRASRVASQQAYKMAGLGPQDIQIAEVHDCFSIAEIIAIEDLGFFEQGTGGKVTQEGRTALDGDLPINTSGGLKTKGHPVGATGVAQAVEIFKQLRGEAEKRQVPDVEIGLTHNVGGTGGTAVVHIYRR
jgi:acetyl-CoA C-acetyltransferase